MEDNKELTLKDLNPNIKKEETKLKPVKMEDIPVKKEEEEETSTSPLDNIFSDMDKVSDQVFDQAKAIVENMYEQQELNEIENGEENSLNELSKNTIPSKEIKEETESIELEYDDEDIDINDFDEEENKQMNSIKADIKKKIQPFMNKIDLASFTISSTPSKVHKLFESNAVQDNVADWVLFSTGIPVSMKEFKAIDIEKLSPDGSTQNSLNTYMGIYRQFYDHIQDDNLPEFEVWLKMIHFYDVDHLYMAAFYASFGKTNLIPYICQNPKCKEGFVQQVNNIWDMVKFKDKEAEVKFHSILEGDTSFKKDSIESELVQISDEYVVGLKIPTLYSVIYENCTLNEKYQEQNADVLSMISFIDKIYIINKETNSLDPVFLKEYPNDVVKTIHYKIKAYKDILESINSDQYYFIQQLIANLSKDLTNGITYQLPEVTCPKCGHTIKAEDYKGEALLFTRHRLPGIASI